MSSSLAKSYGLSWIRLMVIACVLLMSIGLVHYGSRTSISKSRNQTSLASFPKQINEWSFVSMQTFNKDIEEMLGADTYIDYLYKSPSNREIEVIVCYYNTMREGKQFHSPKNCMLGSGWDSLESNQVMINWKNKHIPVNYMLVQKGRQKLYVFYWVQGRGRLIASEYQERYYRFLDSFIKGRTDGAFIRVSLPGIQDNVKQDLATMKRLSESLAIEVENYLPN